MRRSTSSPKSLCRRWMTGMPDLPRHSSARLPARTAEMWSPSAPMPDTSVMRASRPLSSGRGRSSAHMGRMSSSKSGNWSRGWISYAKLLGNFRIRSLTTRRARPETCALSGWGQQTSLACHDLLLASCRTVDCPGRNVFFGMHTRGCALNASKNVCSIRGHLAGGAVVVHCRAECRFRCFRTAKKVALPILGAHFRRRLNLAGRFQSLPR